VIPIEQSMEDPRRNYFKAANISTVVVTIVNIAFAILGYMFFKDDTKGIIILNLPHKSIWVILIKAFLCADILFTYTLFILTIAELIE
jgi:amino acid permease